MAPHSSTLAWKTPWTEEPSIPWRSKWQSTPALLPGKSHGRKSLIGYSPWGRKESDTTERLHFHFSLSCIGEGNGNPLQFSCLENSRDGGTWWAAVYGVAQSRTRLKRLGSNRSKCFYLVTQQEGIHQQCRRCNRSHRFDPWVEMIPWRRKWLPTPVGILAWAEEPGGL